MLTPEVVGILMSIDMWERAHFSPHLYIFKLQYFLLLPGEIFLSMHKTISEIISLELSAVSSVAITCKSSLHL